jgi:hypothetical protein
VAAFPVPTLADKVTLKVPVTVGLPEITPPILRVTPVGSLPVSVMVGAGQPDDAAMKEPAWFLVKVAVAAV